MRPPSSLASSPAFRRGESGNVFVFVILGVVLFAALMFIVSRGMNESPGTISDKKAKLAVSDILAYAQKVERAVSALQRRSVSENDLSFENPILAGYANAACSTGTCKVFDTSGGGISYQKPDPDWLDLAVNPNRDWVFDHRDAFQDIGTTCAADSCVELSMILWPIKKDLCLAINDRLEIDNPGGAPPTDSDIAGGQFTGSFSYNQTIGDEAGGAPLAGKRTGCVTQDSNGVHFFYHVLIER